MVKLNTNCWTNTKWRTQSSTNRSFYPDSRHIKPRLYALARKLTLQRRYGRVADRKVDELLLEFAGPKILDRRHGQYLTVICRFEKTTSEGQLPATGLSYFYPE
jgi:hypothetical protein